MEIKTLIRKILKLNFGKRGGVLPVVMQHAITKEILMLAYVDLEAILHAIKTGRASYHSTSKNRLWVKGEESGNFFKILDIYVDCDGDAIIFIVVPERSNTACHTGAESCFFRSISGRRIGVAVPKITKAEELEEMEAEVDPSLARYWDTSTPPAAEIYWSLHTLENRLKERSDASPKESYTRVLLNKGPTGCAKKFLEEARETAFAATQESRKRLVSEAADALFHLQVLLTSRGVTFKQVEDELRQREKQSGLQEKASRQS